MLLIEIIESVLIGSLDKKIDEAWRPELTIQVVKQVNLTV